MITYQELMEANNSDDYKAYSELAVNYISQELNITKDKAKMVYNYAYEENHAYWCDMTQSIDELVDVIKEVLK